MSQPKENTLWLKGKKVAVVGRLASMTRAEASALIRQHGGQYVHAVNRQTALVVVGQEGLPLRWDGVLTLKLQKARSLQREGQGIEVLTEEAWLARFDLDQPSKTVHRLYTTAQLCQLLRIPGERIRGWVKAGLLQPAETVQGIWQFDFRQITAVKTLWDLAQAGVKAGQIQRSLEQLRTWFPEVEQPLAQLGLREGNGQVLIRLQAGQLVEPSGQQHFNFDADAKDAEATATPCQFAPPWRQRAHDLEDAGDLEAAAQAYRHALLSDGPDAEVCFNLGNVLYQLGRKGQAAKRFRQAVELDIGFAEAWNNLGNVLAELEQGQEAVEAYQQALALNPQYPDAHYNLADTLDQMGLVREAHRSWQSYLRLEPQGQWAEYAKRRLADFDSKSG